MWPLRRQRRRRRRLILKIRWPAVNLWRWRVSKAVWVSMIIFQRPWFYHQDTTTGSVQHLIPIQKQLLSWEPAASVIVVWHLVVTYICIGGTSSFLFLVRPEKLRTKLVLKTKKFVTFFKINLNQTNSVGQVYTWYVTWRIFFIKYLSRRIFIIWWQWNLDYWCLWAIIHVRSFRQ